MSGYQHWLVSALGRDTSISEFMKTAWGWPVIESLHFIGLSLLVGCVFTFDLRLLGMAKRVPIAAAHRLIPWGLAGFGLSVVTGAMFLMTEPNQYIYNPAFLLKILFIVIAGCNALTFYLIAPGVATAPGATADVPRPAKLIAAISLTLWVTVIVCGRLITFYRPYDCGPEGPGLIALCVSR